MRYRMFEEAIEERGSIFPRPLLLKPCPPPVSPRRPHTPSDPPSRISKPWAPPPPFLSFPGNEMIPERNGNLPAWSLELARRSPASLMQGVTQDFDVW